ncbi:Hypothetical predicted protein [Paramuricea clavata]|uniref:Uncharacterized protein n=1 Tax=Paramuricea clavata TaxID=317549 RepID=A0A6S7J4C1_PARCT|nr:Hypothetical predicted protein [Paramuricea clavata]
MIVHHNQLKRFYETTGSQEEPVQSEQISEQLVANNGDVISCCYVVIQLKAGAMLSLLAMLSPGLQETVFALGTESGSALLGVLFSALGIRTTLLIYSLNSGVILVILLLYIRFSKRVDDYEKLPQDTDEE